jgi:hypothetical protein
MSMARKIFYSFLLAAVVCTGMVTLVFTGMVDPAVFNLSRAAVLFVSAVFFLALFLITFFCLTLWQSLRHWNSADASDFLYNEKKSAIMYYSSAPLLHKTEELAVETLETVIPVPPILSDNKGNNDDIFELEKISNDWDSGAFLFSRPFSFFQTDPEILQENFYSMQYDVLYEENGIHYINNSVFDSDYNEKELNGDFAQLVESVINKT